ncbi:hypothetical protein Cpir12675_002229 [Ceratocystis pirilliformis]|uniref:Thioesterase domain-containing protein n=1 Tax=Ceratocystis pirilliformis TaxID=259994 RepID=A0ABR3ZAP5_9PEZI
MDQKVQDAIAHFSKTPWCAALISRPGATHFVPHEPRAGSVAVNLTQDRLFRKTLRTSSTVPYQLGFFQDPFGPYPETSKPASSSGLTMLNPIVTVLHDLQPGVNGFNGTTHGGFISCIIDEAMGSLIYTNYDELMGAKMKHKPPDNVPDLSDARVFTAGISVQLKKPILTPNIVAVVAELDRIETRKLLFKITVKNNEVVFAEAQGLWIVVPNAKSKI